MNKVRLEGQSYLFDGTVDYDAGSVVISPADGKLCIAENAAPAGTPFAYVGDGGVWKAFTNENHFIDDDPATAATNNGYELFVDQGILGIKVK